MEHETWSKDGIQMTVGISTFNEWRYEYRNGTYWISGMSLYSLMNAGWKRV